MLVSDKIEKGDKIRITKCMNCSEHLIVKAIKKGDEKIIKCASCNKQFKEKFYKNGKILRKNLSC